MPPRAMKSRVVVVMVVVVAALLPPPVSSQVTFPNENCVDGNVRCPTQALGGRCDTDPTYMRNVCPFSCNMCQQEGATTTTTTTTTTAASPVNGATTSTTTTVASPAAFSLLLSADSQADGTAATATGSPSGPSTSTSGTPRRSIVNPDFACGGSSTSIQARKRRQVPSEPDQLLEDPLGGDVALADHAHEAVIDTNCGASVISDRFLLTAASCIDLEDPISSVRLGDLDLAQEGESNSAPADYDIIDIFIFPLYNSSTRYHDIALLRTDREIKFSDALFPYCVSSTPPAPGTTVIAAGYGYYNETHKSTHVLEGTLEVMPTAQCEEQYLEREEQRVLKAYPQLMKDGKGLLCAGDAKSGVCEGDEGGPLFREDESGRRFLEGITSFTGSRCSEGILPGVFTAVADYVGFIDAILYGPQQP